jgi:hypothetical protein
MVAEAVVSDHGTGTHYMLPWRGPGQPRSWDWGPTADPEAATGLARSLLVDALGPAAAACPSCMGRQLIAWAGPESDAEPVPYDPEVHSTIYDADMVTACSCDNGIRALPYHQLAATTVARWGDHWRLPRADMLTWLVGQYEGLPDWLGTVVQVQDVELP